MELEYLEAVENREGDNPAYRLQPQIKAWILENLELRRQKLQEDLSEHSIQIFLTLRTYKKMPLFALGYRDEANKYLLEAWYFRMLPSEDKQSLQWTLDRAPVQEIFA